MTTPISYFDKIFAGSDARGVIAAIASISVVGTGIGLSYRQFAHLVCASVYIQLRHYLSFHLE